MAVGSGVPYNQHTGNGVTRSFAYGFTLLDAGDLRVTIDGTETTAFTIFGIGVAAGGSIEFTTAPANGARVLIELVIDLARTTEYQTNGDLLSQTVNADFDRLWQALNVASYPGRARSLRVPTGETVNELPESDERANTVLGFNGSGQPIVIDLPVDLPETPINRPPDVIATQGQTDVTVPFSYTRGNNSLRVFLDGDLMEPDDDYTELTTTSVRFTAPLDEGDEVTFEGGAQLNPISAIGTVSDAALAAKNNILVGYSGPGPTADTASSTVRDKLRRVIVDVADYFITGDADMRAAWNRAVALLNAGTITALAVCGVTTVNGAIDPITRSGSAIYTFSGSGGTSGIYQLSATANTLTFTPTDPATARIDDISIANLAIWNGSALPTAGCALTLIRPGRGRIHGLDIRNHFMGLDVAGGGDVHLTNTTIAGFYAWAAVATGSRCARFRIASYGAVNEVPSEYFVTNFNWKGVTQSGPVNYLDVALEITSGDGLWFNNGHVGFANGASSFIYQNAAVGYISDIEFCKVYFDGNRAGNATAGVGALIDGLVGNITGVRFLGCIMKNHQSHGYQFTAPNAARIKIEGGSIEANGRLGLVAGAQTDVSVLGVDIALNNRLNTSSAGVQATGTLGFRFLGNLIEQHPTYPHGVGLNIAAGCTNVMVFHNTFSAGITEPMIFAACPTMLYGSNRLKGGTPTAGQIGGVLYLKHGFDFQLVPASGTNVTSIDGPNNIGAKVELMTAGALTVVNGGNIGLHAASGNFVATNAGSNLILRNNGAKWCENSRAVL